MKLRSMSLLKIFYLSSHPSIHPSIQLKLCPHNLQSSVSDWLKKHYPKTFVLFTEPRAAIKTAVISQGIYFSDICQVLGTFYAFTKKIIAHSTFNLQQ